MKQAIAYARVSSDKQGYNGIGLDAQMVEIDRFAEDAGYEIVERFREIASATERGSIRDRKEMYSAILRSREEKWPIIVANSGRISRFTDDLDELAREGKLNILVANTGVNGSFLSLRSGVARAEFEGREITKRSKVGVEKAKKRGVRFGNPTNLPEARILAAAKKTENAKKRRVVFEEAVLRVASTGARSHSEIASALNELGITNPSKRPWTQANVTSTRRRNRIFDLKDEARRDSAKAAAGSLPLTLGKDGKFPPYEIDRLRAKMIERGAEAKTIERITDAAASAVLSEADIRAVQRFMAKPTLKHTEQPKSS